MKATRQRPLIACLVLAACLLVVATAPPARADGLTVEKFVMLMRHGVRPPNNTHEIAPYAAEPWPDFGVPDGALTPHGAEVATRLGAWEGRMLAARGFLAAPACPGTGEVFAWASGQYQRTVDTADRFLGGMFPGCGLKSGHHETHGADPLFAAAETDAGRLDLERGRAEMLKALGGSLEGAQARLAPLVEQLQPVLACCSIEVCEAAKASAGCTFANRPWAIKPVSGGRNLTLDGPLGQGSTMVQVILLEYAEGLPAGKVAWGRASTAADVLRLSEIRKVRYEFYERIPYIARRGASNIFNQLLLALEPTAGAGGPPPAKLVLFVGSDTQIAEIGGILGAHWHLQSYLDDETPPTGGLTFELLRDPANGQRYVRLRFLTPKLDQLRQASTFAPGDEPENVTITVPGCENSGPEGACAADRFFKLAREALDPTAVTPQDYR